MKVGRRRGSFGGQCALGRSRKSPQALDTALVGLVERVTRRMRKAGHAGRTVVLRLRFDDFTRATRSHTLPHASFHTDTVLTAARGLLATAMPLLERHGCTLIGVAVTNLDDSLQLMLPLERKSRGALDAAVDEVRARFGTGALTRGVLLGCGQGFTVPLLPD